MPHLEIVCSTDKQGSDTEKIAEHDGVTIRARKFRDIYARLWDGFEALDSDGEILEYLLTGDNCLEVNEGGLSISGVVAYFTKDLSQEGTFAYERLDKAALMSDVEYSPDGPPIERQLHVWEVTFPQPRAE